MKATCLYCNIKQCGCSEVGEFDICAYGISYFNKDGNVIKKEPKINLRHVSQNLRHELNKVLQLIVQEATKIDDSITTKKIHLDNPASTIVGATVIIDQFIEMITGVNDFHPSSNVTKNLNKKVMLLDIVDKYTKIYSLVQNTRRAKNIAFELNIKKNRKIAFAHSIVEYLVSILIDNIWKYSISTSTAKIVGVQEKVGLIDIIFSNKSRPLNEKDKIFEKGYQCREGSEGFGFGLYWANLLINQYNRISDKSENLLAIEHSELINDDGMADQIFILRNVIVEN